MHTYTLIQSPEREWWESPICVTQLLLEEIVNKENTNLFLNWFFFVFFFKLPCLIFEEGAFDAQNCKSQQQPSSSILDLLGVVVNSLWLRTNLPGVHTSGVPCPSHLLPHPLQRSASFTHQHLHTTSQGKNWVLSGIRRHKHNRQHCHLLSSKYHDSTCQSSSASTNTEVTVDLKNLLNSSLPPVHWMEVIAKM